VGEEYQGYRSRQIPRGMKYDEVSVVDTPKESRATITDLLVISEDGPCTWFGFASTSICQRATRIQSLYNEGIISNDAALKFSRFFASNKEGKSTYP